MITMAETQTPVKWHVVPGGTMQTTQLSPTGAGIQDVEQVRYMIDSGPLAGHQRTVSIPVELYNTENVKRVINEDAAKASGVAGLKS